MKKILTSWAIFALGISATFAQDAAIKEIQTSTATKIPAQEAHDSLRKHGWLFGGIGNLSLTQVSNSNWVASGGDVFSLSAAASLSVYANKKWHNGTTWDNLLNINYGLVNTTTLGTRKVNDRIDFVTKLGYEPKKWKHLRYSLLGQFRSQLTNGYDYAYFGSDTNRRNSGFFAPAYVTIAPGVEWLPVPWFTLFASPAATKMTFVSNNPNSYASDSGVFKGNKETPLSVLYGVDSGKTFRAEFGAFITANANIDLSKNIKYIGRLDLYSNYLKNPWNIDVFWTNQFQLKVNRWLQVTYRIDFLYDDDIKSKQVIPGKAPGAVGLQTLSTLGIGVAVKL